MTLVTLTILNAFDSETGVTDFGQSFSEDVAIYIGQLIPSISYPRVFAAYPSRSLTNMFVLKVYTLPSLSGSYRTRHIIVLEEVRCAMVVVVDAKDWVWVNVLRFKLTY